MGRVTEQEFKAWLDSINCHPLLVEKRTGSNTIYFKVPSGKNCYHLYKQNCYEDNAPNRAFGFDFVGIYSVKRGQIFEDTCEFREMYPNLVNEHDIDGMKCDITARVKEYVENYLENDRSKLELKELYPEDKEKYKIFTKRYFDFEAEGYFLRGKGVQDVQYKCGYSFINWKNDSALLDYINDEEIFIQKEGEKYLQEKQGIILGELILLDGIKTSLKNLEESGDTFLRRQRNIIQAMRTTNARMVRVTIDKGGQLYTFKYEANKLHEVGVRSYSIKGVSRNDVDEFIQRFNAEWYFKPEDIVDISYRGKSIYSAEALISEQEQGQGPVQSM